MKSFVLTIEPGSKLTLPGPWKEGERVLVEVRRWKPLRSNQQNRFYHGVWLPLIADELGYVDKEEVCRSLKVRLGYCKIEDDKITGSKRYICPSTASFSTNKMAEYLNKTEYLMAEFGITLPAKEWQ